MKFIALLAFFGLSPFVIADDNPPFIPGNHSSSKTKASDNFIKFCSGGEVDQKILFSKTTLEVLQNSQTTQNINLICFDQLKVKLISFNEQYLSKACERENNYCQKFKESIDTFRTSLEAQRKIKKDGLEKFHNFPEYLDFPSANENQAAFDKYLADGEDEECRISNSMRLSPTFIKDNIQKIYNNTSNICFKWFIQWMATNAAFYKSQSNNYLINCQANLLDGCQKVQKNLEDFLSIIKTAVKLQYGGSLTEDQVACLPDPTTSENIDQLNNFLKGLEMSFACKEPTEKEPLIVASNLNPTNVPANYILKKELDGSTTASIRIKLSKSSSHVDLEGMEKKISECYERFSPFLKGPNGEQLNLKLLTDAEAKKIPIKSRPAINSIYLEASVVRENSRHYGADSSCDTLLHEGFHLLGLVDEYDGTGDGYNCRVVPKTPTIMGGLKEAISNAIPQVLDCKFGTDSSHEKILRGQDELLKKFVFHTGDYYDEWAGWEFCEMDSETILKTPEELRKIQDTYPIISHSADEFAYYHTIYASESKTLLIKSTCRCPKENEACKKKIPNVMKLKQNRFQTPSLKSCPGGADLISIMPIESTPGPKSNGFSGNTFKVYLQPKHPRSLLWPAHFAKIMAGNCESKYKQYAECANWSRSGGDCSKRPKACEDDSYYLGVQK